MFKGFGSRTNVMMFIVLLLCSTSKIMSETNTVKLLITRPNSFDYNVDKKKAWIAPVTEALLYFKLHAHNKIQIIPIEEISPLVASHRDHFKRISKGKYSHAAKELLATHVLYTEYAAKSDDEIILYVTLEPVIQTQKKHNFQITLSADDFDMTINEAVVQTISLLGIDDGGFSDLFLSAKIAGADAKNLQRLGTCLLSENQDDPDKFVSIARECLKVKKAATDMYLAEYVIARLCVQAGQPEKGIPHIDNLTQQLGDRYPKLNIQLASYYRRSGQLEDAQRSIEKVSQVKELHHMILWEKGLIYESRGNFSDALKCFQQLEKIMSNDPEVYFHLAKTSLALDNVKDADTYIQKASQISRQKKSKLYLFMGDEFTRDKELEFAMSAYEKSIELTKDNADAWLKLGDLQIQKGQDSAAAISYINLYNLDIMQYQQYLKKAGNILERLELIDLARQTYANAFTRGSDPQVAIMLATLEFKQNRCDKVVSLLRSLSSPWNNDPEVRSMLERCTEDKNPPTITLLGDNPLIIDVTETQFIDPGVKAIDDIDGDITHLVKVDGNVTLSRPDTFTITYTVTDNGKNVARNKRKVVVVDTEAPEITLKGDTPMHIKVGERFRDPGATAYDNIDGNITKKIAVKGRVDTKKAGGYPLTYTVSDAAGNTVQEERIVNVHDKITSIDDEPPVIRLIGGSPNVINEGDQYNEPGVNATDNVDGDLTPYINIEGDVNSRKAGKYSITYSVSDKTGNKAEKVLWVTVKSQKEVASLDRINTGVFGNQRKQEKLLVNKTRTRKKSGRKGAISLTVGLAGSGLLALGMFTDMVLLEKRQNEYNNAQTPEEAQSKHKILQQTRLLRDASYIASGVSLLGFSINLMIPSKK